MLKMLHWELTASWLNRRISRWNSDVMKCLGLSQASANTNSLSAVGARFIGDLVQVLTDSQHS